jgi:hypothetical protein
MIAKINDLIEVMTVNPRRRDEIVVVREIPLRNGAATVIKIGSSIKDDIVVSAETLVMMSVVARILVTTLIVVS